MKRNEFKNDLFHLENSRRGKRNPDLYRQQQVRRYDKENNPGKEEHIGRLISMFGGTIVSEDLSSLRFFRISNL